MYLVRENAGAVPPLNGTTWNWTCRLCTHSNPDDEDICCQRCGAGKP
ncbi:MULTISPECIES: hypothetical protein [Nocardiopsis]|uniref:Putative paraquat-inducible protein A n=1 Tax=Nocardiopsis aegyptia TaxID=220378 RepID=A0A7Z0EU14_9ACTN|nr:MULTISPECIES: hypothetical protein [Nocardiopsis]NYJ37273.1 putative paraquat-inducible protein A [Nocardiopsis aegyptia]